MRQMTLVGFLQAQNCISLTSSASGAIPRRIRISPALNVTAASAERWKPKNYILASSTTAGHARLVRRRPCPHSRKQHRLRKDLRRPTRRYIVGISSKLLGWGRGQAPWQRRASGPSLDRWACHGVLLTCCAIRLPFGWQRQAFRSTRSRMIAQYLGDTDSRITARVYARYSPCHLSKAALALG
jgi:hypothetical protein